MIKFSELRSEKNNAIIEKIVERHNAGQPI